MLAGRLIRAKARAIGRLEAVRLRIAKDISAQGYPKQALAVNKLIDLCACYVDEYLGRVCTTLIDPKR